MIESIINCKDLKKADVILMTAGYDKTAPLGKGAVSGGLAIVKCLHEDVEFFDRYSLKETKYLLKIAHKDLGNLNDLSPEKMIEKVKENYLKYYNKNNFLILLGGEHSVSIGAFNTLSEVYKPEEVSIVQIDAHTDLRNDDANSNPNSSKPSKFANACVMRRALDFGYKLVQIGVRSYSKEEYDIFKKNKNITVFEWGKGSVPKIKKVLDSIKTKKAYLTIDVDGIDPAFMPATGTPVQGGLEWYYTINLVCSIIKSKDVIGADIMEVAPKKEEALTEYGAAQLCYNIMGQIKQKNN